MWEIYYQSAAPPVPDSYNNKIARVYFFINIWREWSISSAMLLKSLPKYNNVRWTRWNLWTFSIVVD